MTAELVIHFGTSLLCPWDIGNGPKIAVSTGSTRKKLPVVCSRKRKTHYSHRRCMVVFWGRGLPEKSRKWIQILVKAFMLQIRIPFGSWLWLDNLLRRAGSTASISVPSTPSFMRFVLRVLMAARHWQIRPMTFSLVITVSSERRLDLVIFRWTLTKSISDPYILDLLETRKTAGKKRLQFAFTMFDHLWTASSVFLTPRFKGLS